MDAESGNLRLVTNAGDLILDPAGAGNLQIVGIPTSSPGGSGLVWKDALGYLRIT